MKSLTTHPEEGQATQSQSILAWKQRKYWAAQDVFFDDNNFDISKEDKEATI